MDREEEIRRRAYQKYMERVRQGLTVDFEPDRSILERRDWLMASMDYEREQAIERLGGTQLTR